VKGYGVIETGWTRSPLMQPTIELAKSSNTLNKLTFVALRDRLRRPAGKRDHPGPQGRLVVHRPLHL
jgi:hypothetical protein